jgi:O-antigen/teichoic acid export membrane protein
LAISYRKKAIEAASFVVFGFGLSQAIRLFGNIVLTRLLAPELFGLITLARVFVTGLSLFSDIGISPAIMRSDRSDDPTFLNTAWTMQIIRSAGIATVSLFIAFPVAAIYKQPILAALVPVIGVLGLINGFQSTSLIVLKKDLQQRKLILIEMVIQVVSLLCTVACAYFFKNIWALLVGDFVGPIIRVFWSHALRIPFPNKLHLDADSRKELLSFGKWIFVSTAMTFLAGQADRLLLGKFFTMAALGVYTVAVTFAELPKQVVGQINGSVIFPLVTKYAKSPRHELRERIRVPRGKLLLAMAIGLAVFTCFSDILVKILYDQRYKDAEWMLPLLALGMWPFLLTTTIDCSLFAVSTPKYFALGKFAKVVFMLVSIPISFKLFGEIGVIIVIMLDDIPAYIIINIGLAKQGLMLLKQDALVTSAMVGGVVLLLAIRIVTGMGVPGLDAFLQ